MGTKNNPGRFDCDNRALPDEPTFTLLARDPDFHRLVMKWAKRRKADIACGLRPGSDTDKVKEARQCAKDGRRWRRASEWNIR